MCWPWTYFDIGINRDVWYPESINIAVFGRFCLFCCFFTTFVKIIPPPTAQTNTTPVTIKAVVIKEGPPFLVFTPLSSSSATTKQNSSNTFHDFPCKSLGDAQYKVSLCFNPRHTSCNTEQSQFHGFAVRSVTAVVWFNHFTDSAFSVVRWFELKFRYSSWNVGLKVSELLLDGKYNSKLKNRIIFWARLRRFKFDASWFCLFGLVKVLWNTRGFSSSMLLFERSNYSSCSSQLNDDLLISVMLFPCK